MRVKRSKTKGYAGNRERPFLHRVVSDSKIGSDWRDEQKPSERLETAKIAFLTQRIDLSSREAEKFWPLYNEQKAASRNLMQTAKEDEIAFQEAMLVIRKKFKKDLMPILKTEERVNLALKVDRDLLNRMRNEMMRRRRPM